MKIKIKGEMTLAQLRQCLFEQLHEMEERFNVRHVRDVTLYITPTNGLGGEVYCRDGLGQEVSTLYSKGPYRSVADHYDI